MIYRRINVLKLVLLIACVATATAAALSEQQRLNATFNTRTTKSGPIFVLDKSTVFVSLFEYSYNGIDNVQKKNRYFKAMPDDGSPLVDFYLLDVHEETPKLAVLSRDYESENIYLRLVDDNRDITQFSSLVIVKDDDSILASVAIMSTSSVGFQIADMVSNPLIKDNNTIFRYPKCCPVNMYAGDEGCTSMETEPSSRIPVYDAYNDQYNNESITNLVYEPFHHKTECDDMFILDQSDEVYLFVNARLLSSLSQFACLDFIQDEDGSLHERIFMCASININTELSNKIYVGLMYFSAAVLLLWAVILLILLLQRRLTVKTIVVLSVVYSVLYSLHFITLATAREIGIVSDTCKIVGYVYQFLLLASFTSLFALIFECFYRVRHFNKKHSKSRMFFYVLFGAVPVVATAVSVFTNELTLSTSSQLQRDSACWFRSERKVYSYYVPIIFIITCCGIIQILTYWEIKKKRKYSSALFCLQEAKFKNMFRLGAYLNGIMTLCWGMEVLSYSFEVQNNFWFVVDVFNAIQGLVIFCAFSYHFSHVWKKLIKCTISAQMKSNRCSNLAECNMRELIPIQK